LRQAWRILRSVDVLHDTLKAHGDCAGDRAVGIVLDEHELGIIAVVQAARVIRRNVHDGADEAGAQVDGSIAERVVVQRAERSGVGFDGVEVLLDHARAVLVIVVDDGDFHAANFAAEGVAQNDELKQRGHHRDHHQRGAAEKLPHVAFDQGGDAIELHFRPRAPRGRLEARSKSAPLKPKGASPGAATHAFPWPVYL
jgi:hypothetical protein